MESEHLGDAAYACYECIDFFLGIIEGEGGADGAADAQAVHQGLGAMMTCADGNAQTVEQGAHVQMMDVANEERNDGILVL